MSAVVESAAAAALAALLPARGALPGPIAIALSGGLDSSVLLDAFVAAAGPAHCLALHIHHGLSPNADAWLAHAERECARRGVRFLAERVSLPTQTGQGIEATARAVRYAALHRMAHAHGALALMLGQHADDQAETVLLQMLRGSGLPGVAAMPMTRTLHLVAAGHDASSSPLLLMRPFLHLTRTQLELYAARHGLTWIDDESNRDIRFARNALRRDVLPQIDEHFPAYRRTLARFARHAASAQTLCDELAAIDLQACIQVATADGVDHPQVQTDLDDDTIADASDDDLDQRSRLIASSSILSRQRLQALSPTRLRNVLRYWMREQGLFAASEARLNEMAVQLALDPHVGSSGRARWVPPGQHIARARISIRHADHVLRAYRDDVFWTDTRHFPTAYQPSERSSVTEQGKQDVAAHTSLCGAESSHCPSAPSVSGSDACVFYRSGEGVADDDRWSLPRWHGALHVRCLAPNEVAASNVMLVLPHGVSLDGRLSARPRQGGERLRLGGGRPTRSLKHHFQTMGVPAWQRDVPLFYLDDTLIFVPYIGGFVPDNLCDMPEGTASARHERLIVLCWIPSPSLSATV